MLDWLDARMMGAGQHPDHYMSVLNFVFSVPSAGMLKL
jgi:hypothetical protein